MLIKLDIKLRINIKEKLKLQIQIQNNFGNKNFSKKFTQNTFQIIDRKQQEPMQVISILYMVYIMIDNSYSL